MYVVFLTFSAARDQAAAHMEGHKAWLAEGFAAGVFLMAGSLQPGRGGAILAAGCSREELDARMAADPFVQHDVARPEIHEISPARADERLQFLLETAA
jgi:uncharacterized protein YciI